MSKIDDIETNTPEKVCEFSEEMTGKGKHYMTRIDLHQATHFCVWRMRNSRSKENKNYLDSRSSRYYLEAWSEAEVLSKNIPIPGQVTIVAPTAMRASMPLG